MKVIHTLFLHFHKHFFIIFSLFLSCLVRVDSVLGSFSGQGPVCPGGSNSHGQLYCWPFLTVLVQYCQCTPSCKPGLLCKSVDLHSVLPQLDFIILLDRKDSNIVLPSQLFAKGWRHNLPADVGRCIEMPFPLFLQSEVMKRLSFLWLLMLL